MSSLPLAVSIPATTVVVFVIFVDPCLVKRTKLFRQPSGSDEGTDDDHATGQLYLLRVGSIRSPAALPRTAIRGRAFLSEQPDDIRLRYYKGGQRRESAVPTR